MDDEKSSDETYADDDPGGFSGGRIPPPPVPRDEWVAQVVDDPASGLRPVLLQGYVGDAADKESTRIYLDASLGQYVDVRNEDVLHHQPLEGDHAPIGGSMVWVRGDALVSPGTGGGSAAAGGFFTGPVLEHNRQPGVGGAAQPAGPVQITLLTVAGCFTRIAGCSWICPPPVTRHAVLCSWVCRDPLGGIGPVMGTVAGMGGEPPLATDRCPPSVGCFEFQTVRPPRDVQPLAGPAPMGGAFTRLPCSAVDACPSALGCTLHLCGPIGVTAWRGCEQPHISLPGCVHTGTCSAVDACPTRLCQPGAGGVDTVRAGFGAPQAAAGTFHVGCHTLGFTCTYINCPQTGGGTGTVAGPIVSLPGCIQPTRLIGCTGYLGCVPHISVPGCVPSAVDACPTRLCPPNGGEVETVRAFAAAPQAAAGIPTGHYSPQCPTFGFTCTYVGCPQAGAEAAAPQAAVGTYGPGCTLGFTCTYVGCPQAGAEAAAPQAQVGTYGPGCTLGFTCTYVGCPPAPQGAEAAAPQAQVGTYGPGCTLGFTCTYVGCPAAPQGAGAAAPQAAAGIPTGQYSPQCPSFGFTCTYVDCPPQTVVTAFPGCPPPTGPMGTAATVCTQLGCPRTSTCPPTYTPGCGGAGAEVAAAGAPTRYQGCYTFGFTCTQFC